MELSGGGTPSCFGPAGAGWIKPPDPRGVGVTLLMWGVFTLYMWVATFRTNFVLWTVFLLLWITFFLLAGGDLGMGVGWHKLGGWFGLATGFDALYLSFAEVVNATFERSVICVGGPIIKGAGSNSVEAPAAPPIPGRVRA